MTLRVYKMLPISKERRTRFPNRVCHAHTNIGAYLVSVEEYLEVYRRDYGGVMTPFFDGSIQRNGRFIIACICET